MTPIQKCLKIKSPAVCLYLNLAQNFQEFMQKSTLVPANLWGHVIRCPAEGVCCPVQVDLKFTHPKVSYANMAIKIKQNVVQFQISET